MDVLIVLAITGAAVWWFLSGNKTEVEVVAPVEPVRPLSELTKAELLEVAEDSGIEVKKSWTKAKIVQTIQTELDVRSGYER